MSPTEGAAKVRMASFRTVRSLTGHRITVELECEKSGRPQQVGL